MQLSCDIWGFVVLFFIVHFLFLKLGLFKNLQQSGYFCCWIKNGARLKNLVGILVPFFGI